MLIGADPGPGRHYKGQSLAPHGAGDPRTPEPSSLCPELLVRKMDKMTLRLTVTDHEFPPAECKSGEKSSRKGS